MARLYTPTAGTATVLYDGGFESHWWANVFAPVITITSTRIYRPSA